MGFLLRSAIVLAAVSFCLMAQRNTQITGRITDQTDAVVPAARVTLANEDTGIRRETLTNELGYYVAPLLPPGRYRISAEKEGFKPVTQSGITLTVDQAARVDIVLDVGRLTESVQVTANVTTVETQSSALREVVDERRIRELPLNGRDATQLILLLPGVYGTTRDNSGLRQAGSGRGIVQAGIASNGARGNMVNYSLDGATHNDTYTNIALAFPNPDALQEFSVQTNNFSAESGRSAGAVVNAVTRSGTNEFHGSVFEFHRNSAVNARNFFARMPDGLKRNQFGGTFGGPIWRNHTFFFFSHQETRERSRPADANRVVLTAAQRRGDFSGYSGTLTDPLTRQPFPGNMIPLTRLNPLSRTILERMIPLPNDPSGGALYYFAVPNMSNLRQTTIKIDHQFGTSDTISGRYLYNYFESPPFELRDPNVELPLPFASGGKRFTPNHNASFTHTHMFSPAMVNQAQFSFNRRTDILEPIWTIGFKDLGMRNVFTDTPTKNFGLNITGAFSATVTEALRTRPNAWTVADTLRWTRGRHETSMGFDYRKQSLDKNFRWLLDPNMAFAGIHTGYGVADFYLGMPSSLTQMAYGEVALQDFPAFAAFFQDNIRISPKFTLNLGIRYEPAIPYRDRGNRVSVFRPGAKSQVYDNAPAGLLFGGDPGVSERGTKSDLNNWAPRIGFAWNVANRTSVRAAYGIFFDSSPMSAITNVFQGVAPFGTRITLTPPPGPFDDPFLGENPFPMPFPPPKDIAFPAGLTAATWPDQYRTGYLQSWHFTIEREIFPAWLVRVAYAGSKGTSLLQGEQLNPAVFVPGQSTAANIAQRRPYSPAFTSITEVGNNGSSNFSSLQLSVDRRFRRNFIIQANYTWAKSIDYGSGGGTQWPSFTPFYHEYDRGLSDFHHAHRFVTSGLWELPQLATSPAAVRWALGSWQLSGAVTLQSGAPFSVNSGRENSLVGYGNRADLVGDPSRGARRDPNRDPVMEWFNTGAFAHNAPGTYGNSGRNIVFGPGLANMDISVAKYFNITERWRVQLRGEAFNVANRSNFNDPDSSLASGTYGRILSAMDPRILQFGLKVMF
jgi:hypothetical protein